MKEGGLMFKKFMSYYKQHIGLFIFDLICALLVAAMDLVFPLATKYILNEVIPDKNMQLLIIFGVALLAMFALRFLLSYFMGYYGHVLGIKIETSIRGDLFKKFETLDYQFYDNKKTGELLANLTSHMADLSEMAHHAPEDILTSVSMIVGSFVILVTISWPLTLIIFAAIALLTIFALSRKKKRLTAFRGVRTQQGELIAKMENSLSGIHLTQAYSNEDFELEKFAEVNNQYKNARSKVFKELGIYGSGITFFTNLANLFLLVFGGIFVFNGTIDYVDLITFFLYINFLITPIRMLANSMEQIQSGWTGFEKFYEVMQTDSKIKDNDHPIIDHDFVGNIVFENVNFEYHNNEENVLSNFNLTIPAGQSVALVGETGVGKSTISKLIPRFYDVSQGAIKIDGINVKDFDLYSLRSAIGHVQQDVFIFWGTIKDNILYGDPQASDEQVIVAAKKANIHDFIMSLEEGYETLTGERGIRLSGGQKQRIAIARLFLKNPKIIILDEATSSLDNVTERQVQKAFEQLAQGKTTLIIAHRLTTVRNCDQIVVLGKDGIIEAGSHDELMKTKGAYQKMYDAFLEFD